MDTKIIEHKVAVAKKSDEFKNVPENLKGIELGDALVVKNFPRTHKYTPEQKFMRGAKFKANNGIRYQIEDGDFVTFNIGANAPDVIKNIITENGYTGNFDPPLSINIFVDQLEFLVKKVPNDKKAKLQTFSIVSKSQEESILKEMISLVDVERIRKTMNIAIGRGRTPKDGVLEKFIHEWAVAKYDFYLMFGKKLSVTTPISFNMDEGEISPMVYDLYKEYPKYAASLEKIIETAGISAFMENKAPECKFFDTYCHDTYKEGMRLSKFFSQCFKDADFDLSFSKIMQNREIRGNVVLSIDPFDFITSSTNMHGWTSCHRIYNNSLAGASFSWCLDPNALIAFRDNGKMYTYDRAVSKNSVDGKNIAFDFGKNSFEGHSKSWRQIINVDKDTTTALFGREYPARKTIEAVADKARELFESVAGEYLGVSEWDNFGDLENISSDNIFGDHPVYECANKHHYDDPSDWESLLHKYPDIKKSLIAPSGTDMSKAKIKAGGNMFCLICGKPTSGSNAVCSSC